MEADRVIVELIAKTDGFDSKVKQSAATFDSATKSVEGGAQRMTAAQFRAAGGMAGLAKATDSITRSSGNARSAQLELGHVARAIGDQLAVGTPISQIFAQHIGQVGQAAAASGSSLGKFAGFLGGPFGIALTLGTVLLAKFAFGHKDAANSVEGLTEKLKENAEKTSNSRIAQAAFADTLEGVTEAIHANSDAIKELSEAEQGLAERATHEAAQNLRRIESIQIVTQALIDQARAQIEATRAQAAAGGGSLRDSGAAAEQKVIEDRLDALQVRLGNVNKLLGTARANFRDAFSAAVVERAEKLSDPLERIKQKYESLSKLNPGLIEQARRAATTDEVRNGALDRQVKLLKAKEKAELDAARAANRVDHSNDQSGREVNEAQARAIVASIGGTVTSGTRTAQHNADVGGVPNSFHVKGQALDIAKTAGMTLGKIVQAFEKAGVHLIEKLDEGDHFHVAFGKRGRAGPSDETLAKRAEAARVAAEQREQAFDNELANLQGQELDARKALMTSAEEISKLELQAIGIARTKYNDQLASLVSQKKLLPEEAKQLQALNDERAGLRAELVARREDERKFRIIEATAQNRLASQTGSIDVEQGLLHSREGLADTARQRHDLEQRLIDLQFQEEKLQLEAIIAETERLKIKQNLTEAEQAELDRALVREDTAKQQLNTLPERQANAQAGNDQANASPLQSFFGDIPNTAEELNASFEKLAAGGLASVVDGITEAIMGMRSWGDVGRAVLGQLVAGLIKMGIQQILLATVGQSVAAASTAANAALGAATAAAWAPAAAAVSLATFGANAAAAAPAMASVYALSSALAVPKGFLTGGYTGGGPVQSAAGIVHGQEFVFDARATRRIGVSNLEALRNGSVRPSNARAASPGGGGGGLSSEAVAQLGGIVRQAIEAMPAVNLYPTLDPAAAFEAALNTPRGRRKLLEFMGDNQSSVGGTQ